jgi:hypothetical protein
MRPTYLLSLLALLAFAPATAEAAGRPESPRTTFLLSRAADGGFPNGPSRNGTVSHDQRIGRYMAYESDASNIVAGDSNGVTDVFVVARQAPWGNNGTPWTIGATQIASSGLNGQAANGRSYRPALDGDSHHRPHCVAFISEASNLVPGDTNGRADAFVRDLRTGRIKRVSVDSRGRQSNGTTTEVAIDGACERVAFVSDATNLALRRAGNAAWESAETSQAPRNTRQVYVHVLSGSGHDAGFRGLTFLASASSTGRAGNGDSYEVAFSRAGKSIAFTSNATNLARGDRSRTADVYRRGFIRKFRHLGNGRGVQTFVFRTDLASATGAGRAGNGPSSHPSITDDGRYVAYETVATNLLAGDVNGVSDIARADLRNPRRVAQVWVSKAFTGIGNGASNRPVISGAGEFVLFDSEATNLKPSESVRDDANGVRDVFLWNAPTRNVSLESRDAENGYLATPSQAPATSSRGNYVPFESANPLIDLPLVREVAPSLLDLSIEDLTGAIPNLIDPSQILPGIPQPGGQTLPGLARETRAGAAAAEMPALQQVYVRYLGPK